MSQLFYLPEIYNGATILDEEETRHCTRVLRLREGDPFLITDGRGSLYHCELIDVSSKRARFIISSKEEHYREREIKLHIAIAPTKNTDRFEWFLEKATEIGVDEITPLLCQHSERTKLKTERLEKV
ncbi:MAG: RsmE family RNA methyltransferase, partial [Bacteroidota bacterium]